jgi:hypothetical protein
MNDKPLSKIEILQAKLRAEEADTDPEVLAEREAYAERRRRNTDDNQLPPPPLKYIYRIDWFHTRRHIKPHTSMYFEKVEHTKWALLRDYEPEIVRVEYIWVASGSREYKMAVESSQIEDTRTKKVFLVREIESK